MGYEEIKYENVSDAALLEIQELQAISHRNQFLLKLRPEYESVWSSIMS